MRPSSIRRHRVLCLIVLTFLLSGVCVAGRGVAADAPEIAVAPIPGAAPATDPPAPAAAGAGEVPAGVIREDASDVLLPDAVLPLLSSAAAPQAAAALPAAAAPQAAAAGWRLLLSEDFEGAFPTAPWTAYDYDGLVNGEYYWDEDDHRPYLGLQSAWAVNGGTHGIDPAAGALYPNDVRSWMVAGPLDLSNDTAAQLQFHYWNRLETAFDWFGWYASTDGTTFYGDRVSGVSSGRQYVSFDLTAVSGLGDVTGDDSVWIAFVFTSDSSVRDEGPYVDDVLLRAYTPAPNLAPVVRSGWPFTIVPSSVPGTHTVDTLRTTGLTYVDWAVVNNGDADAAGTFRTCLYLDGDELRCWTSGTVPPTWMAWVTDWVMDVTPAPGEHTLRLMVDVDNVVAESYEADNAWEHTFAWQGSRVYLPMMVR